MDSIHVYTMNGLEYKKLHSAPIQRSGNKSTFHLSGSLPAEGFYMVGQAPNNLTSLILGQEKGIDLRGNCMDLRTFAKVEGSMINEDFRSVSSQFRQLQEETSAAEQRVRIKKGTPEAQEEARQAFKYVYSRQVQIVDSLKQANPFLSKVFALNIFPQFDPTNNPQNYANNLEHFAGELFAHADLQDPDYDYIMLLSENMRAYTQILFQNGSQIDRAKAETFLDQKLAKLPQQSLARKNVMATVIDALERSRSGSFAKYAEDYLNNYETPDHIAQTIQNRMTVIQAEATALERLSVGAIPPEISLPTPDGNVFKLSSLKGKVVLLDFWASWCKPCRQENPNVVRVYQKYNKEGFEILSISLDRDKSSWLKAIKDDNMTWHHVSDLKFWQSAAAQEYQVKAIPATFLLDKEGRIVAKNLRGPALEAKLAEVFASS